MPANTQPQVTLASDESMTVVALNAAAMHEAVRSWPKLQPRPVLPPLAEQAAALSAILTAQREANLAAFLERGVNIKGQMEEARRDYRAEKAAADAAGDRPLVWSANVALARAAIASDPDEAAPVTAPVWGMG